MPKDWLPVPHYRQTGDGQCLPACARMVLDYLGRKLEEGHIAKVLQSCPFGTPAPNIRNLETLGLSVAYGQMSVSRMRSHLQSGNPCIIFVQAGELPYSQVEGFHAIVVVGLSGQSTYVNDPALGAGPQAVPLDDLRLAWSEFEYVSAVVTA